MKNKWQGSINHSMLLLPKNFSDVIFHSLPQKWWTLDNNKEEGGGESNARETLRDSKDARFWSVRCYMATMAGVFLSLNYAYLGLLLPLAYLCSRERRRQRRWSRNVHYAFGCHDKADQQMNKTHGFEKQICSCKVSGYLRIGLRAACYKYQLY